MVWNKTKVTGQSAVPLHQDSRCIAVRVLNLPIVCCLELCAQGELFFNAHPHPVLVRRWELADRQAGPDGSGSGQLGGDFQPVYIYYFYLYIYCLIHYKRVAMSTSVCLRLSLAQNSIAERHTGKVYTNPTTTRYGVHRFTFICQRQ